MRPERPKSTRDCVLLWFDTVKNGLEDAEKAGNTRKAYASCAFLSGGLSLAICLHLILPKDIKHWAEYIKAKSADLEYVGLYTGVLSEFAVVTKLDDLVNAAVKRLTTAASAIDRLTASLQRLGQAVKVPGLERLSKQMKALTQTPNTSKIEQEIARLEKQAENSANSVLKLQKRLEDMQVYRGIGSPETAAGVEEEIQRTEKEIERLGSVIDNADNKIRTLRKNLETGMQNAAAPIEKVTDALAKIPQARQNAKGFCGQCRRFHVLHGQTDECRKEIKVRPSWYRRTERDRKGPTFGRRRFWRFGELPV